jgi:hypothetical protein
MLTCGECTGPRCDVSLVRSETLPRMLERDEVDARSSSERWMQDLPSGQQLRGDIRHSWPQHVAAVWSGKA